MTLKFVLAVLSLLGGIQGLLLAVSLSTSKRGSKTANRLLAALIAVVSIFIFGAVVRSAGYELIYPHLSRIHDPFTFLAGPLLFLYLRTLVKKWAFQKKDFLHFLPFIVCLLYLFPYYFQSPESKYAAVLAEFESPDFNAWYYVRSVLVITHVFVYLAFTMWMLFTNFRKTKIERTVLTQIRFLAISCLILWIIAILRFAFDRTSQTNLLVPLGVSIMIYGLGYIELRNPAALSEKEEVPKYNRSNLTAERSERYLKKLLHLMETEKPYIDSELNLQKLANALAIPPHYLSQTINEKLNQSFSEFINTYRVEEAKRRLLDPKMKHLSILAIAEDVGFNSKSSFNAVFKKQTNLTPSEFRKKTEN